MTWQNQEKWQKMVTGQDCPMCQDIHLPENDFSFLVKDFKYTYIRLPKNQFWKGMAEIMFKKHATELYQLSSEELLGFWQETAEVARAINKIFKPVKIDYLIYGHLCPHLHCHVIPQYLENDPQAPVNIDKEIFLSENEYQKIIELLHKEL